MKRQRVTQLEKTKMQAELLVPLIEGMERELGREQAHRLVRESLGPMLREAARASNTPGEGRQAVQKILHISKSVDAQDHVPAPSAEDEINVDITRCEYAEFFQQLGRPDLGFLLVCERDFDLIDGLEDVEMRRTTTIMTGSRKCDFRFRFGPGA